MRRLAAGRADNRVRGRGHITPKEPVPLWRWAIWWVGLGIGMFLFYVLLTPIWLGLRVAAWLSDLRRRSSS